MNKSFALNTFGCICPTFDHDVGFETMQSKGDSFFFFNFFLSLGVLRSSEYLNNQAPLNMVLSLLLILVPVLIIACGIILPHIS